MSNSTAAGERSITKLFSIFVYCVLYMTLVVGLVYVSDWISSAILAIGLMNATILMWKIPGAICERATPPGATFGMDAKKTEVELANDK